MGCRSEKEFKGGVFHVDMEGMVQKEKERTIGSRSITHGTQG
jgi:hypothetical protein